WGRGVPGGRRPTGPGPAGAAAIPRGAPRADAGQPLEQEQVIVVGEEAAPPGVLRDSPPKAEHEEIARRAALLVPAGGRLEGGPSPVGDALLRLPTVPVTIDSGLLPDAVADLASRGLLIGDPVAT